MLRTLGALILAAGCTLAGYQASLALSKRVSTIETLISFLESLTSELRFTLDTPSRIFRRLSLREEYLELEFLGLLPTYLADGLPFPEAFGKSLETQEQLGEAEVALLTELGTVLGSTDLQGQLGSIAYIKQRTEEQCQQAKSHKEGHAKLYSTLGLTAGAAVFILLV